MELVDHQEDRLVGVVDHHREEVEDQLLGVRVVDHQEVVVEDHRTGDHVGVQVVQHVGHQVEGEGVVEDHHHVGAQVVEDHHTGAQMEVQVVELLVVVLV